MRPHLAALIYCALLGHVAAATAANPLDALKDLGRDIGGTSKLLPPDQAFKVTVRVKNADTLIAEFAPAKAYYLYRNKLRFGLIEPGMGIAAVKLPQGEDKADVTMGRVEVYRKPVVAEITVGRGDTAARKITLETGYQGCSEKGVCYAPMTRRFELQLPAIN
jgi:thiol:disulfide interchange protein DsbD